MHKNTPPSIIHISYLTSDTCPPSQTMPSSDTIASSLGKLKIDDKIKSRKAEPAESWEDEVGEEEEEDGSANHNNDDNNQEDEGRKSISTPIRPNFPGPPPPTPSSPTEAQKRDLQYQNFGPLSYYDTGTPPSSSSLSRGNSNSGGGGDTPPERRPDKTTAVASRLIAAGLGQRAPKRTPEQREYDQAMKVQEKKKRDKAKAEEEQKRRDTEAAKKAIWDD